MRGSDEFSEGCCPIEGCCANARLADNALPKATAMPATACRREHTSAESFTLIDLTEEGESDPFIETRRESMFKNIF